MNVQVKYCSFTGEKWWKHQRKVSFFPFCLPPTCPVNSYCRFVAVDAFVTLSDWWRQIVFSLLHIAFMLLFINCSLIATCRFISVSAHQHWWCHRSMMMMISESCPLSLHHWSQLSPLVTFDLPTCHHSHYHRESSTFLFLFHNFY